MKFKYLLNTVTFRFFGTSKQVEAIGAYLKEQYGNGEYLILSPRFVRDQDGERTERYQGESITYLTDVPGQTKIGTKAMNKHQVDKENLNIRFIALWVEDGKVFREVFSKSHKVFQNKRIKLFASGFVPSSYNYYHGDINKIKNAAHVVSAYSDSPDEIKKVLNAYKEQIKLTKARRSCQPKNKQYNA